MSPVPTVGPEDVADVLVRAFDDPNVRVVAVVTAVGEPVGIVTDGDLLDALLPSYVLETKGLAAVLDEASAATLSGRLASRRVRDVMETNRTAHPSVSPDDTLVEIAAALVRSRDRAVAVVEKGRVLGAVNVEQLLHALIHPKDR
jgi:CBS domain-containing protein